VTDRADTTHLVDAHHRVGVADVDLGRHGDAGDLVVGRKARVVRDNGVNRLVALAEQDGVAAAPARVRHTPCSVADVPAEADGADLVASGKSTSSRAHLASGRVGTNVLEDLLDERLGDALAVTDEPRAERGADLGGTGGLLDHARLRITFLRRNAPFVRQQGTQRASD